MPESRFERYLVAANRAIIFLMMAVMATLVFVNVVTRYVFNFSIIWAEEVSQYLMIWIAYLGAGLALREGRHVAVEMLQDRLPAAQQQAPVRGPHINRQRVAEFESGQGKRDEIHQSATSTGTRGASAHISS